MKYLIFEDINFDQNLGLRKCPGFTKKNVNGGNESLPTYVVALISLMPLVCGV